MDELGGAKPNEAIRLKFKYLITDVVLNLYTWRGTGDKKAFKKLIFLNDLIFKSVRTQFKKYTFKEYGTYAVQWLKHSKTRQRTVVYSYPTQQIENDDHGDDNEDEDNY